ncbi:MAG: SDR family NAD(P)-dependent oxidoreductase [Rudaea sp.]|uniref:SDR family NAD(P)-dependent oxidoreductase n=1 Tax=Rudaea sp. TaxID=2136325 RepID=UPI0039E66C13
MEDFRNKVAVVTGGASGVGRALAQRLAAAGARVVIADINAERVAAVAAELREATQGEVSGIAADVTKENSVDALADQVHARHGAVHLLFNNAGVGLGEARRALWTLPLNDWRWGLDVNVLGVVHGIKAFVPRMLEADEEAVVVNTSSANGGLYSLPNTPIYAATKAAVTSLTEVLHQQLLREGKRVRAAVLYPGPNTVNTAIMASKLSRPAEYAGDAPEDPVAYKSMQDLIAATGLKMQLTEPEEVADFALAGIRAGRFWLIPESERSDLAVRKRTDSILARATPESAW